MAQKIMELINELQRQEKLGKDIADFLRLEGFPIGEVQSAFINLGYVASIEQFTRDIPGLHVSERPMKAGLAVLSVAFEPRALPLVIWYPRKPKHFVFEDGTVATSATEAFWNLQRGKSEPLTEINFTAAGRTDVWIVSLTGEKVFEEYLGQHYAGRFNVYAEKQVRTWLDGIHDD